MTDAVDTSKEAVERFAEWAERGLDQDAADLLRALVSERDQLRREVDEARSVRGAAQVLMAACPNPIFDKLKPVLMGEFSQHYPFIDEDGDEVYAKVNVSWTVTKDIIKAALNYLATGSRP